ncbi:MAG: ABC transporter ATP-binding protein [Chlamydiia bacterium]|nr:ABC transporter ATP-binding protein [Chlamydiia bacterium]
MTHVDTPVLSVKNLTTKLMVGKRSYVVVDDLSFNLFHGKTLAIVGESGCGKSMTAYSIMRILPHPPALPPEGKVLYRGKNLLSLSPHEMRKLRGSKIAMIFQDPMNALNPVYTIGYQLGEVARLHLNLWGKKANEMIIQALSDVGIHDPKERLNDYPHQYSGGMLQRVMIAMALLGKPDILIADEPTTALDVTIQKQILNLMVALQKKREMAILLITHDMGVVAEMADEVIVMYATQKIEEGSVEQIFAHPSHPYSEGLFKARPTHPIKERKFYTIKGSVPHLTILPSGCHFHPRCPYVMPICQQGIVPTFVTDTQTHQVKCWLFKDKS